jgi:hypothetical protein
MKKQIMTQLVSLADTLLYLSAQYHLRKPLELWAYDRGYLVMWPGRQEYIDWCRGKRPL